ncbi:MAG TPA: hypothetical protein DCF92_02610 [Idiomarina sp.]|nr:hypothetical protein [Idiomarina sp.]
MTLENVAIDSSNFSDGTTITARAQAVSSASAIGVYDKSSAQTVGVVNDQYSASFSDSFDQTIDVNNSRKLFDKDASGADDTSGGAYDTVALAITDDVSGTNYSITPTSIVHTINAEDLGYAMAFDANEDGELSSGELCGTSTSSFITLTPSVTCAIDGNKLTITDSNSTTSVSLQFNAPGTSASQTLTPQSFTASVDVKGTVSGVSGTQTASAASSASAGSWDLNGASVYVPYMPYASGLSQIIYVSNKGSQSGEIEVTAFDDAGNEYGPYDLGTAGAKDITKITGGLEDALAADGFTSGKLAFTVTVTAPSNSIEVYTGYNAGNDRGLVINSSNR